MPKLFAFDLDDTLAPSKSPLPDAMRTALLALLEKAQVAIISGGQFGQFQAQVIRRLPESDLLDGLHLMPTSGTRYYKHAHGEWREVYAHALSEEKRRACAVALEAEAKALGLWEERTWGPQIEDRGSQVTFSALGQEAPVEAKKAWDPDGSKRELLRERVQAILPDLDVHSGGSTSIDITDCGIDKAYGIRNLMQYLDVEAADILFVGDRLQPGGNDYPVIATGVQTRAVKSWEETAEFVADMVNSLQSSSRGPQSGRRQA